MQQRRIAFDISAGHDMGKLRGVGYPPVMLLRAGYHHAPEAYLPAQTLHRFNTLAVRPAVGHEYHRSAGKQLRVRRVIARTLTAGHRMSADEFKPEAFCQRKERFTHDRFYPGAVEHKRAAPYIRRLFAYIVYRRLRIQTYEQHIQPGERLVGQHRVGAALLHRPPRHGLGAVGDIHGMTGEPFDRPRKRAAYEPESCNAYFHAISTGRQTGVCARHPLQARRRPAG